MVTVTPTFGAKDITESTIPAQREAKAAELKAAAEEKASLKAAEGKKGKSQRMAAPAKTEAPKWGRMAAGMPALSKEAKDAAKTSGRNAMTGLNASINSNTKSARKKKKNKKKKKKRQTMEQQGKGGSGQSKGGSSSQPPPTPLAPRFSQVIDSTTSELS